MVLKKIEIEKENNLKQIILKEPEVIEQGFKIITDEFPTDTGSVDILGVDSGGVLTIIELKIKEEDMMLMQALRYYDSISQNLHRIAHLYSNFKINTKESPRIILVAPGFSELLKKSAKYVELEKLDLIEFDYLKFDHTKDLFCRSIDIETPKELPVRKSVSDHLGYITDEKTKKVAKKVIDRIKKIGDEIEDYGRKFYIGFKYKGHLFARIKTKRNFFYVVVTRGAEWEKDKIKVEKLSDFTEEFLEKIKDSYEEVGGKVKTKKKS